MVVFAIQTIKTKLGGKRINTMPRMIRKSQTQRYILQFFFFVGSTAT